MVGVSDDVNEYAMALRDTEDKLRRCPKRVRLGWADGFQGRRAVNEEVVSQLGLPREGHRGNLDCPAPASGGCPVVILSLLPQLCHIGESGVALGRDGA